MQDATSASLEKAGAEIRELKRQIDEVISRMSDADRLTETPEAIRAQVLSDVLNNLVAARQYEAVVIVQKMMGPVR